MSYKQTLWKEIKDVVNSTILKKENKAKKWKYGYNKDYDFVVISKTGQIGQVIEIQNLRIALPAIDEPFKRSENKKEQYWEKQEYPKELVKVAKEPIVDTGEDVTADRLKNAAATKKLAIFDAFEILKRIQEEEELLIDKPKETKEERVFKGFAEGRSK